MSRLNEGNELNSKQLLNMIFKFSKNNSEIWLCFRALIGTNGSSLEYLIYIDKVNGGCIEQTIKTINGFDLWDVILTNPAAGPIIDHILNNFHLVKFGIFTSKDSFQSWLFPRLGMSPLVGKYITVNDIKLNKVDRSFFRNTFAIDLILEFVDENNVSNNIVEGLVIIATSFNEDAAIKAIDIIEYSFDCNGNEFVDSIDESQWASMLQSPYARSYAKERLLCDDLQFSLLDVVRSNDLVPQWVVSWEREDFHIINLSYDTIKNIDLDDDFYSLTSNYVNFLSYQDWNILLKTNFGVSLAIDNIGCIIDKGLLFELLGSKYVSKELLYEIRDHTDAFDYAGDEEFTALISRNDAYEINLNQTFHDRYQLCQEILMTWFEPNRLQRIAMKYDLDLRSYMNCV